MTDPGSYLNQLRTFMQFYNQNGPQAPMVTGGFGGMYGGMSTAQNQADNQGNALRFALSAMQQGQGPNIFPGYSPMPNYFGGHVPQSPVTAQANQAALSTLRRY